MRLPLIFLATALALFHAATANPPETHDKRSTVERGGVVYNIFEHAATGSKLESVSSRICEKSKKIKQYSGYVTVAPGMHMWFWFFEARQNPSTAPLVAWLSGSPGVSSMRALFNGNGPCNFRNGKHHKKLKNNPHSFNNYANMIYIDWQIGTGFSYGNESVTAKEAAPYIWNLLQAFYSSFPDYKSRDFGIFTDSYGAHYGPIFAKYILDQNKANVGEKINIVALGVSNGLYDWKIQAPALIEYAYNNSYRTIIDKSQYDNLMREFEVVSLPHLEDCANTGNNTVCSNAFKDFALGTYLHLSQAADFNPFDIRQNRHYVDSSFGYFKYLQKKKIMKKIGAKTTFQEFSTANILISTSTGDQAKSYLDELAEVVSSNITTLIWAGDADWICNWYGVFDVANSITYSGHTAFASKSLKPYTVNGKEGGTFKTEGKLSFLRVYNAGHDVPHDQPELSLQVFIQTMKKGAIEST